MNHTTKVFLTVFLLLLLPGLNKETVENKTPESETQTDRITLPSNMGSNALTVPKSKLRTSAPPIVYCTGDYFDEGRDEDGDGLFERIDLFVEINWTQHLDVIIELQIQPLVQGESPNSNEFEVSKQEKRDEGIHLVIIPLVNVEDFLSFTLNELSFHIKELSIVNFIVSTKPIFSCYDPYTTRVYSRDEFIDDVITGQIWDKAEDSDWPPNLKYDCLLIEIEVMIRKAGKYQVEIELVPNQSNTFGEVLKVNGNQSFLESGINVISVALDASLVRELRINGSLVVTQITVIDKNKVIVDKRYPNYVTQVYSYTDFDVHKIAINGNEEFNRFAEEMELQGNGSPLQPYIIEGLVFIGAASWNIISIENIDVSFQITNNIIQGSMIAIKLANITNGLIVNNTLLNNQIGVYLTHVNDCIIRHNTISGHNEGISLVEADNNLIESNSIDNNLRGMKLTNNSDNNVITDNTISNSVGIGILLANTDNNMVQRNDFLNNSIHVYEWGLNTTLSSNYWGNGTPYRDLSPLETPNHLSKPIFLSPLKGETILDPVLVIKWIANDTLGHVLMYDIYCSADYDTWALLSAGETVDHFDWDVRNVTRGSYYQIKIVAYDSLGFTCWDISDRFTIQTPINPTPIVSSLYGITLLIIVSLGLFIKFK